MIRTFKRLAASLISLLLVTTGSYAQFTTVINVPPDIAPPSLGAETQLNLFDGGVWTPSFPALTSTSELNVFGGTVIGSLSTNVGTIKMMGGIIQYLSTFDLVTISNGEISHASNIGSLFMSGGKIGDSLEAGIAFDSSDVTITGGRIGDFARIVGGPVSIDGGEMGDWLLIDRAETITVSGGIIGDNAAVVGRTGEVISNVLIQGGKIGHNFKASSSTTVAITGGAFGDSFKAVQNLSGSDFRINGVSVGELDNVGESTTVHVPDGSVLSGTLSDGTPFAFSSSDGDRWNSLADTLSGIVGITLTKTLLPPAVPYRTTSAATSPILGVRDGEELLVDAAIGKHFNAGRESIVNVVDGGSIGDNFEAVAATVHIGGGTIGPHFQAFDHSTVNISGGLVEGLEILGGSSVHVSGGNVQILEFDGGLEMTGGVASIASLLSRSGVLNLSGGQITLPALPQRGSFTETNILGREFYIDGERIDSLIVGNSIEVQLAVGQTISGRLSDGSAFSFLQQTGGRTGLTPFDGTLTVTLVPEPSSVLLYSLWGLVFFRRRCVLAITSAAGAATSSA